MTKSVSISGPAWALLDMLQRDGRGGPVPDGLKAQFMELRDNGLARMSGPAMKITEAGEAALRGRVVGGRDTSGRWSFIRHHGIDSVTWLWQRFGPDGRLQKTSQPQPNYGKALVDALDHGFRPSEHDYSVDLPHGKLHFPPGRNPVFSTRISEPKPPDVLLPKLPRKESGLHRVIGSYTTQRDGRRTYKYELRWSRRGTDIAWEAYVFLDGKLMGQPSNIVPCHNTQLSETIIRAFLENAIEEMAAKH